jgi:hypothetical protein
VLGEGSFGVVVKARQRGTGEAVAFKRDSRASTFTPPFARLAVLPPAVATPYLSPSVTSLRTLPPRMCSSSWSLLRPACVAYCGRVSAVHRGSEHGGGCWGRRRP